MKFKIEDGLELLSCTSPRSDRFDGTTLDPRWEILRSVPTGLRLQNGRLSIDTLGPQPGQPEWDMKGPLASAKNVLLQKAPTYGPWRTTTTIDTADLTRFGAPGAGIEAGIVVWEAENPNKFSKFVLSRGSFSDPTYVVKQEHTVAGVSTLQAGRDVSRPTGDLAKVTIRVTKSTLNGETYGEYSLDGGASWMSIGDRTSAGDFDGPVRIGLVSRRQIDLTAAGFPGQPTAHFERFDLEAADCDGPTTTAALEPGRPTAGGSYTGPVNVALSATDPVVNPSGAEPKTHVVTGLPYEWDRKALTVTRGDTVKWDFAGLFHDVCIDTTAPAVPQYTVNCGTDERVASAINGATSGQRQFNQAGTYTFYCSFHMPSMTGTVTVEGGAQNVPSGVAFTEYRVDEGQWTRKANDAKGEPFKNAVTVAALGKHVVEFRSGDRAENEEAIKSVAFEITEPKVEPIPDPGTPQPGTPPAANLPGTNPPDTMPQAKPTATKLKKPAATTTGKFAKQGLKVSTACEAGLHRQGHDQREQDARPASSGSRRPRRSCLQDDDLRRLRQRHDDAEALQEAAARVKKSKQAVTVTVKVTMGAGSMATSSSQTLKLKAAK